MMTGKMQNRFVILYNICFVFKKSLAAPELCALFQYCNSFILHTDIYITPTVRRYAAARRPPDFPRARKSFGTHTHDIRR